MTSYLEPSTLTPVALLPASERDRYFDYCLEPYRPRRPSAGRYRSENLLWHSLAVAGATRALRPLLLAIQDHLGTDLTVWGVKWDGARLWWELYFYDPRKEAVEATFTAIARVLAPWFREVPEVRETIPYMMVSFDLAPEIVEAGVLPAVNLYLTGEKAHAGRSYRVTRTSVELENTYRFLPPKRDVLELLPLLESSVFVDYSDPRMLGRVLVPELFACKKICVSKKRHADAIYFSGVEVGQLLWFLKRFAYPPPLVRFLETHREGFEHLYFDVGIDYRWDAGQGALVYPKTSYYGTL